MSLTTYLNKYYKIQDKIVLCFRRNSKSYWGDRCLFLDQDYSPIKPYNHRSILQCEVVIEFDDDNVEKNKKNADMVASRLYKDGIHYAKWHSGNKSIHVHCLLDMGDCSNIPLLKNTFMRYYCEGLPLPDLRLCENNHMIRAEYGMHEKTFMTKTPISKCRDYFSLQKIPKKIWLEYSKRMQTVMQRKTTIAVNDLTELPIVKLFLNNSKVREIGDGRERILFILIHVLKKKYKKMDNGKEELQKFLWEWYKYSSGCKIDKWGVYRKVSYHWNRDYCIGFNYLYSLAEELGIEMENIKETGETNDREENKTRKDT